MPDSPEDHLTPRRRKALSLAKRSARQVLRRRFKVLRLARNAYGKLGENEDTLTRVRDDLTTMLRLAAAWARKEYQQVPWRSLIYVVAALIYFLNPVDLLPDALVGLGFVDDIAVVGAVVSSIHNDLEAFRSWQEESDAEPQALLEQS